MPTKSPTVVLGLGSWGTALAMVLAENGHPVRIWGRDPKQCMEMNELHTNSRYLPGVVLPPSIYATDDMEEAFFQAENVLYVVPSHAMREVVEKSLPFLREGMMIIHATKGLEQGSLKRMSQVIRETVPDSYKEKVAVLSGPSHAEEVAVHSPTTVVATSERREVAEYVQDLFINPRFRVYTNPDVIGVEIGGSLKNIIAIGAGMSDGLGFGDNAKAALLTRGLAEIGRLGVKMGANLYTFAGLTGVGDLIVTGTSRHSRNWRAGKMLGEGKKLDEVLADMGMVVEGVKTTDAAYRLSIREEVDMPITRELYQVLFQGKDPRLAVEDLMGRGRTHEVEETARLFP
ncbi:NAD(P)H-dependent glycerol-3-phosphate dehydrogenase [[Clostridium] ultunense Esp]|nr:NAD(P)H-dependent glycerol-3-phosphate dehydrogenase [[Clostridium] ultunense Esp]